MLVKKKVKIGSIYIGGGEKIAVQSMTNVKTEKIKEVISQINELNANGCDIVRLAVKDDKDATAIKEIKKNVSIPLVADIHFDYKLAIKSIENGIDKIRINPGNIGSEKNVKMVADCLKEYDIPVRVGSNTGSIEKEFLSKYGKSEISLVESALKNVYALEKYGVEKIVISTKASDVNLTVKAYRYLNEKTNYPLHIGVTEAGTLNSGIIKSSVGIGALLLDGIGDTIRVSLTANPLEEPIVAKKILRSVGLDNNYVEVVSCPTCGRTEYDSIGLAERIEKLTKDIKKPLKIAVMGCVVNGPGEAKDCDLGIAGSKDFCVIFKKGEIFKKVPFALAEEEFIKELNEIEKQL
ncbi:MAG: flavodoxin-dependent (E)-4-hydroxy-3-methylbut-2-enyl-diphosphate synthase [Clostridia bacterium]|nr:flavodoxin-dependent (E)-4-hydroxy-3-methylbut-2-enyl-diphosphate synthase [Clostridia bacterium]